MKLFVGLGNPGKEYAKTRHNVGFIILDAFQETFKGNFSTFTHNTRFNADISEGTIEQEKVLLVKPQGFYNTSGHVAHAVASYYKLSPEDIFFIHDDLDLAIGTLRISKNSSAAGNNGIKDAIEAFGTQNIARLRIGIHNTTREKMDAADFVLQSFTKTEKKILEDLIPLVHQALVDIVEHAPDIEHVQNIYN